MLLVIKKRASKGKIEKMAQDFDGYIKLVVDVEREILAGGEKRRFEGEQKLLQQEGSKQENLWGGGLDLETKGIDCDSIINLRPNQGNSSREILSPEIRKKFVKIVKKLLL